MLNFTLNLGTGLMKGQIWLNYSYNHDKTTHFYRISGELPRFMSIHDFSFEFQRRPQNAERLCRED